MKKSIMSDIPRPTSLPKKPNTLAAKQQALPAKKPISKFKSSLFGQVALLGLIDIICVLALVLLLVILPQKAAELKRLKSLQLKAASKPSTDLILAEIGSAKQKSEKLEKAFPDEIKLLEFVQAIDELKTEGVITHFSFVSNNVVKDRTGLMGLPLVIEFAGSGSKVDYALRKVQQLPFLLRAVTVEVKQKGQEELINLKYGGILYVDKDFGKN